jgi:hypothetical protein
MVLVNAKSSLEDYHQMVETGLLDDRHVELLAGEIVLVSRQASSARRYILAHRDL